MQEEGSAQRGAGTQGDGGKQALGSGGDINNNVRRDYDKYGATAERPTLVGQQEGYNTYKLHLHLPVYLPIEICIIF